MTEGPKGRILVLFGNIPLYGQERENIETIAALRDRGFDALFVTHRDWGHERIQPELDRRGLRWTTATFADRFDRGMSVERWVKGLRDLVRAATEIRRIALEFQPTHIHLGNPAYFLNFLLYLLFSKTPVVYRIGDRPSLHRWPFKVLWRVFIAPRVAQFVCVSRFIERCLLEAVPLSHPPSVIYGVPPSRPTTPTNPFRDEGPRVFTFCYVGQITEEKGVGAFVAVATALCRERPDVRFLIAGDYSWRNPFAEGLIARIEEEGLGQRVRFVGYVEDISGLMTVSDVHVCPSIVLEAMGATVLEAKAAGLPSVVFPSGGLVELVRDGEEGFVCREPSADALEQALRRYLARPDLAKLHGSQAKRGLERFGGSEFGARWEDAYSMASRSRLDLAS